MKSEGFYPDASVMSRGAELPIKWHAAALLVLSLAVGVLFLQEPQFGDDFTYWSFAFDLHERGFAAWSRASFHDLRWPVWGWCWLVQAIVGPGLTSYYCVPLIYLSAGALLSFAIARVLFRSTSIAWTAGIAYLFHPLLDAVAYRPMPDLSEGVLGAAAFLCWWQMLHAVTRTRAVLFAALAGLAISAAVSNRLTGIFIVPVLGIVTLLFFPRRAAWLLVIALFAGLFTGLEALFYKTLFGDWHHLFTANLEARGKKGTESINLFTMPFRFLDTLWKGGPLAPVYCLLALGGSWLAWRRHEAAGRVVVVWLATLYLGYSCGIQSLRPIRPLLRDADRFLCALAVPMSVLAALAAIPLAAWLWQKSRRDKMPGAQFTGARAYLAAALAVLLLVVASRRNFFDMGFVPEFRRYLATVHDGSRIFTHKAMRELTFLCDATTARRLTWLAPKWIIERDPQMEAMAASADQFWYARKLALLKIRKRAEGGEFQSQPPLGSYFDAPEHDWAMARLLAKGDTPDLIFYRRRNADSAAPIILRSDAPELQGLLPQFPASWASVNYRGAITRQWSVPAAWRGKLIRLEIQAAASPVEPFTMRLLFKGNARGSTELLLKPYLFPKGGKDFFTFQIPANAERCEIELRVAPRTTHIAVTDFRLILESPPES